MFPKKERFNTSDFSLIKSLKPRKVFTHIGVFCIYDSFKDKKFAIIASKKIFKTAVLRNKHKRIFFNYLVNKNTISSLDCLVFYPNKTFTKEDMQKAFNML